MVLCFHDLGICEMWKWSAKWQVGQIAMRTSPSSLSQSGSVKMGRWGTSVEECFRSRSSTLDEPQGGGGVYGGGGKALRTPGDVDLSLVQLQLSPATDVNVRHTVRATLQHTSKPIIPRDTCSRPIHNCLQVLLPVCVYKTRTMNTQFSCAAPLGGLYEMGAALRCRHDELPAGAAYACGITSLAFHGR